MRIRIGTICLLALSLLSCSKPLPPDTVTVAIEVLPKARHPVFATDAVSFWVLTPVTEALVRVGRDLSVQPELATKWEWNLPRRQVTFHLRQATFHNGEPFTCADVEATATRIQAADSPNAPAFKNVESVACPDDRTAVITLKEPSPAFLVDLVVMRIVPRSTIPQTAAMWKHPIGTGPFQWKSDDDRDVILSRYDNYWGNKPQYSTLRFRTYTDPQSRLLALKKGDIDIAINSLPANLMDSAASDPSIGIEGDDGITYQFISINHRNPILKKKQVRQALMYGIDREAIIRLKLKDQAKLANNLLPGKSFFAFRENPYPYNPAKSAALLKQLGYSPEKPLKLELKTSTDAQIVSVGLIIKEQLKKVGFDIELKSLEWGTFYDDIKKGNFDLHVSRWTGILDPNCYYDFLHSSQVPPGKNRGAYSNKEFDAWTEKGRTSFDLNDRKKIYTKVQEIFADDVPYVSLWHYKSVGVFRKDRISQLSVPPNGSFDCLANVIKKP